MTQTSPETAIAKSLADMVKAIEDGAVRIDSPNIGGGDPEIGYEPHYWHEEWLHYAKQALGHAQCQKESTEIAAVKDRLSNIYTWLREPDWTEEASLEWLIGWVDRRPIAELAMVTMLMPNGCAPLQGAEPGDGCTSRPALSDTSTVCPTCNGRKIVGGFVNATSGYQDDPCPDCSDSSPVHTREGE